MQVTPITRKQWQSVLINTLFAFIAAFVPVLVASDNWDKSALVGAATAGVMASLKIVEKALKTE